MGLGRGAECAPTCGMELRVEEKETHPGQTLPTLPCSMEDSKAGLAEHYENLFIKVGRENRSYLIVFWLGLHILNIHTYVSGPPFVSILTLSPTDLRCGPDWTLLDLLVLKVALPDFLYVICHSRSI